MGRLIHMIKQRHPSVADTLITGIHRCPAPCFAAVRNCQGTLEEGGWQHRATRCLEEQHLRVHSHRPCPRNDEISVRPVGICGIDSLADQTSDVVAFLTCAACSRAGVLGTILFPLERAAAQVCREACGRVGVDRFVRDLDLVAFNGLDQRRIEVIVDFPTLWHGAQFAVDTTLVSPLHGDGSARRNAATTSGVGLRDVRRAKERTYPELTGEGGRARLVVAADVEGGGARKLHYSSELWRRPGRKSHPSSCRVETQQHT